MRSARRSLAIASLALSVIVGSAPARSAATSIVGTVVKQSTPIKIVSCSAVVDGDVYTPNVQLAADSRAVVVQTYGLTFFDATGNVTGHAQVSPPFVAAIAPGGSFSAFRCDLDEMRLDDGTNYTSTPPSHDSHAFGNAIIGIGILAAVGFLASRHTANGRAPTSGGTATSTPASSFSTASTPTPSPTPTALIDAKARPSSTLSAAPPPTAAPLSASRKRF